MAKCVKCGIETKLFDRGVAICPSCSELQGANSRDSAKEIVAKAPPRREDRKGADAGKSRSAG